LRRGAVYLPAARENALVNSAAAGNGRRLGELMALQKATVGLASGREGKRKALGVEKTPSDRPTLAEAGTRLLVRVALDKADEAARVSEPL
jgi:hypothetical protein